MKLTETIKLNLTKEQKTLVEDQMKEYIKIVNDLVSLHLSGISIEKFTSKDVTANLNGALRNQCIRDAKSIIKKYQKRIEEFNKEPHGPFDQKPRVSVLRKPCCYINNQNFRVKEKENGMFLEFPVWENGKSRRLSVKTKITDRQKEIFSSKKLGTLRIIYKGKKICAQIPYQIEESEPRKDGGEMGVDLGILCPAVASFPDGSIKFYGNGRENKFIRRQFKSKRKELQIEKHFDKIRKIKNKETRIMRNIDHQISHDLIKDALAHNVKVIKLERLSNIRSRTRKMRKDIDTLHNWSFYRLSQYIEYKARRVGIQVKYVNPRFTSKACPVCGHLNNTNGRHYRCRCGFHSHRDIVGAINIRNSTEYVGGQ